MTTEDKIPTVILSDQVKEQMAKDPEIAKAMQAISADFRQAMQLVSDGKYASFDDAIEALTGKRPQPVDLDDEDLDEDDE